MSTLKLGTIKVNRRPDDDDPPIYLAVVSEFESGPMIPTLVKDVNHLDQLMGTDLKYSNHYRDLILSGLPILFQPVLDEFNKREVCSLRLCKYTGDGPQLPISHPRLDKVYDPAKGVDTKEYYLTKDVWMDGIYDMELTHAFKIQIDKDIVIPEMIVPSEYEEAANRLDGSDTFMIDSHLKFKIKDDIYLVSNGAYHKVDSNVSNPDNWKFLGRYEKDGSILDENRPPTNARELRDKIVELLSSIDNSGFTLTTQEQIYLSLFQSYWDNYPVPDFDVYNIKDLYPEWVQGLQNWLNKNETFIDTRLEFIRTVKNLKTLICDEEGLPEVGITKDNLHETIVEYLKDSVVDKYSIRVYSDLPVTILDSWKFDGISIVPELNPSLDKICEATEDSKLIEFYSKSFGNNSKELEVSIERPYPEVEDIYLFTFTQGPITENYLVSTTKSSLEEGIYYPSDLNLVSDLVTVRFYDYKSPSRGLLDSSGYDPLLSDGSYEEYQEQDYTVDPDKGGVVPFKDRVLPLGSWKLNRDSDLDSTNEGWVLTMKSFMESGWYPDLVMIPEIPSKYNQKEFLEIISYIDGVNHISPLVEDDISLHSQSILSLSINQTRWVEGLSRNYKGIKYVDSNKLLMFYGDLEYQGNLYPPYHFIVDDIIELDYLKIPREKLLTSYHKYYDGNWVYCECNKFKVDRSFIDGVLDTFDIETLTDTTVGNLVKIDWRSDTGDIIHLTNLDGNESHEYEFNQDSNIAQRRDPVEGEPQSTILTEIEFLDIKDYLYDRSINIYDYDNIDYFLDRVLELNKTLNRNFLFSFVTSRLSRDIMKNKHSLIGTDSMNVRSIMTGICDYIIRRFKFVDNISYELEENQNKIYIQFEIILKSILNKELTLNYVINS